MTTAPWAHRALLALLALGAYANALGNGFALDDAYLIAGKVMRGAPNAAPLQDTLGWIEFKRGNTHVALKHISRSVIVLSFHPEVHFHLGVIYAKVGKKDWARFHLSRAQVDREKMDKRVNDAVDKAIASLGS